MKNSKPYREYDRWETKAKKSANREYRDKKSDQSLQLAVEPPEPRERFDPILYDTFPEDFEDIDEAMTLVVEQVGAIMENSISGRLQMNQTPDGVNKRSSV